MKYIRTGILGIVLFSETRSHDEMAERLMRKGDEVISAGFVHADDWCDDGQVVCSGRSVSLGISSLDEDTEILRRMLKR
jgi:hypothetical protein